MSDTATKRCRVCGESKPLDDGFYRRADAPDGYRSDCRDCVQARTRRRYETKFQAVAEQKRKYQASHKERVLAHYGERCACCGAASDLSIDHIDGNGKRHREELFGQSQGRAGNGFYFWLVKQGFPAGYQTLCRRCNISKGRGKSCILDHVEGELTWGRTLAATRSSAPPR